MQRDANLYSLTVYFCDVQREVPCVKRGAIPFFLERIDDECASRKIHADSDDDKFCPPAFAAIGHGRARGRARVPPPEFIEQQESLARRTPADEVRPKQ